MNIEEIGLGQKVKWKSRTGQSYRSGFVEHIFDFSNVWPDSYPDRIFIRIKVPKNKRIHVIKPISQLEKMRHENTV